MSTDLPTLEHEVLGRVFGGGRYTVERVVGRGGAAVVVAARDRDTGHLVALKVARPRTHDEERSQRRFEREIRVLGGVRHPHLLPVFGLGEERDGLRYAVMELVEGGSASEFLRQGRPFAMNDALRIAFEVASALVVAHDRGIIHRDIKPGNLLLSKHHHVLLADFGIARSLNPHTTAVTEPGDRLGTVGFEAPEIRVDATKATAASDIYALGSTLYALSTCRVPPDLSLLHLNDAPVRTLPAPLRALITRATAFSAEDRHPDALAFAADIAATHDALAPELGVPLVAKTWMAALHRDRLAAVTPARAARWPWVVAVVVAAALLAVGWLLR